MKKIFLFLLLIFIFAPSSISAQTVPTFICKYDGDVCNLKAGQENACPGLDSTQLRRLCFSEACDSGLHYDESPVNCPGTNSGVPPSTTCPVNQCVPNGTSCYQPGNLYCGGDKFCCVVKNAPTDTVSPSVDCNSQGGSCRFQSYGYDMTSEKQVASSQCRLQSSGSYTYVCIVPKTPSSSNSNSPSSSSQCLSANRTVPVDQDPDINLRVRNWGPSTNISDPPPPAYPNVLINNSGDTDPQAPQLSTLLGDSLNLNPLITSAYQVNNWNWSTNSVADPIATDNSGNWGVTLMELQTDQIIRVPKSGYQLNTEGYQATVLYATPTDLTIKYTLEDDIVHGYAIHLVDIDVNPELLKLYQNNETKGRPGLVALPCGYNLGTPTNSHLKVAIRDTGAFIDPRVQKDWWHDPAQNSCPSIPPKILTPLAGNYCNDIQKKGPLEEGFYPVRYDCNEDTGSKPEFHPLRPYPGSPCDPLIPRSVPQAPQDPNLKYNTFACGSSLTPSKVEIFDPYGDNSQYEALTRGGYAHTWCEPRPPFDKKTQVTCYRTSEFNVTVDFKNANLGILGNTQDTLTDAQKVNEYLSWYLTGTPQIGDQLPINPSNPKDIDRVINFSGPLRKLLPFDLQNTAKSTIVQSAGTDVHNYIVGCKKEVNLSYVLTAITNWFNLLKASIGFDITFLSHIPVLINDVYNIVVSTPETAHKLSTILQSIEITDYFQIQKALIDGGFGQWASDLAVVGEKGANYLHELGKLIDSLNLDVAVSCQTSKEIVRLKEQLLVKGYRPYPYPVGDLPPDPSAYTSFGEYWKKYNNWRGLTNVIFIGAKNLPNPLVNESVWAQLFQNVPFSSMEDTPGEVTLSVFRNPAYDQQTQNITDPVTNPQTGLKTAPLELIIKSATLAAP